MPIELAEAAAAFLHAALNHPRAARMLLGEPTPNPKTGDEVEDHNTGVALLTMAHRAHPDDRGRAS